ncbi:MAG: hypothetical protein HS111_19180 [Kofleriaceae bacterium]|nr:hypothetical protein [Kofleriaceae bacterium]MCL4226578.1 hypothetical protein [Myxococcales bacterium]
MRSLTFLLGALVACGGASDAPPDPPLDAALDAPIDAAPMCNVSSTAFGSLGARPGVATWQQGSQPNAGLGGLFIPLEESAEPDQLYISLWSMTQQDPEPIVAGTYPLVGPQLQLSTCTVCVAIGANWAPGGPAPLDDVYVATGGTVVITTIETQAGGALEIGFEGLTFEHAVLTPSGNVPAGDGCVTSIDDISFSGTFQ